MMNRPHGRTGVPVPFGVTQMSSSVASICHTSLRSDADQRRYSDADLNPLIPSLISLRWSLPTSALNLRFSWL